MGGFAFNREVQGRALSSPLMVSRMCFFPPLFFLLALLLEAVELPHVETLRVFSMAVLFILYYNFDTIWVR